MNSYSENHPRFGHRCYHFSTTGRIIYDPNPDKKKREPYWCIADVEKDITKYYREQFKKNGIRKVVCKSSYCIAQ